MTEESIDLRVRRCSRIGHQFVTVCIDRLVGLHESTQEFEHDGTLRLSDLLPEFEKRLIEVGLVCVPPHLPPRFLKICGYPGKTWV